MIKNKYVPGHKIAEKMAIPLREGNKKEAKEILDKYAKEYGIALWEQLAIIDTAKVLAKKPGNSHE
jgi:hypothetical protein